MSMRTSDRLAVSRQRAKADDAKRELARVLARRLNALETVFLDELATACIEGGIDYAVAAAHAMNESRWLQDQGARNERNFFGLGHPDNASGGIVFESFRAGARFYVWEMLTKLRRLIPASLADAPGYAPDKATQVQDIVEGALGEFPIVRVIADLNDRFGPDGREAVWMSDKNGPQAIVSKGNLMFLSLPDQQTGGTVPSTLDMTKGLIPLPDHVDDPIDVTQRDQSRNCRGYDFLGDRPDTPKFLVLHKSQCPPGASNSGYYHARCCPALTDWEVIATTGQMRRFVGRGGTHEPSGWANGVVSNPYGDALKWLNLHGGDLNTVNRDGEAIEITGWFPSPPVTQDTPVSEAALQNIAQWIASRAHDYGISYETFPMIPAEDRSYVTWHQEWTIGTGKTCPGPWVMNHTEDIFARARAIMADAQTGASAPPPKPPDYAAPIIPDWLTEDLKKGYPSDHKEGDLTYYGALRPYEALRATNRLQGPDTKAEKVGPRIAVRERFRGLYVVTRNGRAFVVTQYASYVDAKALTPSVSIKAR